MQKLKQTLEQIGELDQNAMKKCQEKLDNLTKPPGSLGMLEELAVKLAGISGNPEPVLKTKTVVVMAGDHGVVTEGVSAFPQEVTPQMVMNFLNQGAAINVLCNHAGARVLVVDVGINAKLEHPGLISRKVMMGTENIAAGPAMSRDQAVQALEVGIEIAGEEVARGASILGTGEMGIGNTTPSSAILAACNGLPLNTLVGRGTGIQDDALANKIRVITHALEINQPDAGDGIDLVAKVGGLEIAAMAGLILGAAASNIPVIIDGFISSAAALVASRISPACVQYMIASHASVEPGHQHALKLLGLKPMLHMNMRLGEGTGAALALNIVEASTKILREMATFSDAGVSKGS